MEKKKMKKVDKEANPGLAKLPTGVRNKMGYMKNGGKVKPKGMKTGGVIKPKGMKTGGAQVSGTGFKGIF